MLRITTICGLALLILVGAVGRAAGEVRDAAQPKPELSVTARIPGMARAYRVGERVSIDLVVRNTTNRPLQFKYLGGWWWASPSLAVTREGKKQEVRQSILLGAVPILTKQLQPGKSVELPHVGLWIGRAAEGHGAEPTLVAPAPGKYLVELGSPLSHDLEPTARVDASVEFEVVAE